MNQKNDKSGENKILVKIVKTGGERRNKIEKGEKLKENENHDLMQVLHNNI